MSEIIEQLNIYKDSTSSFQKRQKIQDTFINLTRKLKMQMNTIDNAVYKIEEKEKLIIFFAKQTIQKFQILTTITLERNSQILRIKSSLNKNVQITLLQTIEQKKMGMKYLFGRLVQNCWYWEPNISINISNGVFIVSHTLLVSKDFLSCYPIIYTYFKTLYYIQSEAIKAHLPKILSFSSKFPENYSKVYQIRSIYARKLPHIQLKDEEMFKKIRKYYHLSTTLQNFKNKESIFKKKKKMQCEYKIQDSFYCQIDRIYIDIAEFDKMEFQLKKQERQAMYKKIQPRPPYDPQLQGENKYIFNYIDIIEQKQPIYYKNGGFNDLLVAITKFTYKSTQEAQQIIAQKKQKCKLLNREINFKQPEIQKWLAIKKPKSAQYSYKVLHQKQILKNMRVSASPYLLKYYYCYNYENILFIDPSNAPSLAQYLFYCSQTVSLITKLVMLLHVSNALTFLKKYQIVHMDLKPQNILAQIRALSIRIIDFGQSYERKLCSRYYKPGNTLPYAPPELFKVQKTQFTHKSDIFSFGIVLYSVLFSKSPFTNLQKLRDQYINDRYMEYISYTVEQLNSYGNGQIMRLLVGLTLNCLNPNQNERPEFQWISLILYDIVSYLVRIG